MARFYLDNDVALAVRRALRELGHDAITARDAGAADAGDEEQLLIAARQRRILISHNWRDFRLLPDAWRRWASAWGATVSHAGIIVVEQGVPAQLANDIDALVRSVPDDLDNGLYRQRARGWQRQP